MLALSALLALVFAAPERPSASLDGCDAVPIQHGWQYECPDVRARMEDRPEAGDGVAKYVAGMVSSGPAVVGEGAKTRTEKRKVGAADAEVFVTEAPGKTVGSYVTALPYPAGTRVLLCFAAARRCSAVMAGLAALPWGSANAKGTVRKEPAPLVLAGKPVKVPAGCEATTQPRGGQVVCAKTAWVGWVLTDEGPARQMRSTFRDNIHKALDKPGWKLTDSEVPCKVASVDTTCARVLAESRSGSAVVLWAIARTGEDFTFANCMSLGARAGSPCSLVFELP